MFTLGRGLRTFFCSFFYYNGVPTAEGTGFWTPEELSIDVLTLYVAYLLFMVQVQELDNFIKDFKHINLVFQHIIFISLHSSIFPLLNERTLFLSFFIPKL